MKNVVITLLVCVAIIGAGAWLLWGGDENTDATPQGSTETSFRVIGKGTRAILVETRKNYRIQDEHELEELWGMVYGGEGPDIPPVDFNKDEVLGVFEGAKPTGGYSISVKEVTDNGDKRQVTIVHKSPDESCRVTESETAPFEIIVLPIGGDHVNHTDEETMVSCS